MATNRDGLMESTEQATGAKVPASGTDKDDSKSTGEQRTGRPLPLKLHKRGL